MKRNVVLLIISAVLVGLFVFMYPSKNIEDRLWIYKFNSKAGGSYFTDGEGYYFSSKEETVLMYSDIDKKFDTDKCEVSEDLGVSRSIGNYSLEGGEVKITKKEKDYSFSVIHKQDTVMWGCHFAQVQLILNKEGRKEVYRLFSPK